MSDQQKSKDLRDQLSGLWRSTVDQLDGLKDVIIRQSHVGRKKIDTAMLRRQRDKFLQDLGELVLKRAEDESLDLGPEGLRLAERVREIDEQIGTAETEISRIHQGETPESTGEFAAVMPEDEPAEPAAAPDAEDAVEAAPEPPAQLTEEQASPGADEQAVDESEASSDKEAVEAAEEAESAKPKKRTRRAPRKRTTKAKPKDDKED